MEKYVNHQKKRGARIATRDGAGNSVPAVFEAPVLRGGGAR